jgi:hypothetical protein
MNIALAPRLILYHKQSTSARTRFLRFADSMLAFSPLPPKSAVREEGSPQSNIVAHPAPFLRQAEQHLGLAQGALRAEADYYAEVDTGVGTGVDNPGGTVAILLAEFTAIDPPFEAAEAVGGRFVAITEARDLPAVELELVRRAYTVILG